jgi:MFS transporter, putative metabolite:H+ symporter
MQAGTGEAADISATTALAPQQITGALDRSDFTSRHILLYASVVFGHLFDGFDINMMGLVLPGIAKEFHLTRHRLAIWPRACSSVCWLDRPS